MFWRQISSLTYWTSASCLKRFSSSSNELVSNPFLQTAQLTSDSQLVNNQSLQTAQPTYNLYPIVKHSPALSKLVRLGVKLNDWEKNGHLDLALSILDFDRDAKPYLEFLINEGFHVQVLGKILTEAPLMLKQDLEHLKERINYLDSKKFSLKMRHKIITKCGNWLIHSVEDIDNRLGYFQKTFMLSGEEVRRLAVKCPDLITWIGVPSQTRENLFSVKELMGFKDTEIRTILLNCPSLFKQNHEEKMTNLFSFLHNKVGYSHHTLASYPEVLLGRLREARERHEYLTYIGRNQYDNKLPNYVSPTALVLHTDNHFCKFVAKTKEELYDSFLRTL